MKELEKHLPGYEKGRKDIFARTRHLLDDAIKHAKQVETYNRTSGSDNPSTRIYALVEYLRDVNKK